MALPRLLLLVLLAAGCAGSNKALGPKTYGNTARALYERGMTAFQKSNYLEAIQSFQNVKRRFPYSRWAVLAELRIADSQFQREQFLEAIDAYKLFIKFHPTNENVPYAQYQIALSYLKQAPEDWWFLPPSHEKDLTAVHDAIKETKKFLKQYPGSGLVPKGRELLKRCERKLADHELYVARFYANREKWTAAAMRLEYIIANYGTLASDPDILWFLGTTYRKLGKKDKAKAVFEKLLQDNPNGPHSAEARQLLRSGV